MTSGANPGLPSTMRTIADGIAATMRARTASLRATSTPASPTREVTKKTDWTLG